MRRHTALAVLLLLTSFASGESLRGPLHEPIVVTPTEAVEAGAIELETIVPVSLGGDPRFLDAIDIELTAPAVVGDQPGALTLSILGPVNIEERSGIADVVGEELLFRPLMRGGKSFYQVVLRDDASPDASPVVTRVEKVVTPGSFPLVVSIVPRMKGLAAAIQNSEFAIAIRPVTRNIGAIEVRFIHEDGTFYDADSSLAPDFELFIDGNPAPIENEYLLEPGLHRVELRSQRFQNREVTVGVDRGRATTMDLPLELSLATVNYTTPRGSTVYVNGRVLDSAAGDFTVPPGEHTIVVVIGDYTVTRRIHVEEQRAYSVSVNLDIDVEEIK